MSCLGEATVLGWLDGALTPEERTAAQEHTLECAECLELVAMCRSLRAEDEPDVPRAHAVTSCDERYALGREIGAGGMGRVYEAKDAVLGRSIAIKMVRDPSRGHVARFRSEVAIASLLEHPSIVPVYDAGTFADGSAFCAMRLVRGESLSDAIAARPKLRSRLSLLPALVQVADAIAYAHDRGVLHRDIKPQNILLGPFGETMVLDWGLAKILGTEDEVLAEAMVESGETRVGQVLGTPGYMAPEQSAGRPADERSDVYALGIVLKEVIFGAGAHKRTEGELALRGVPRDLVAIALRATHEDAQRRYQKASDFADDLKRFSTGQLVTAQKYSYVRLARRWLRKRQAWVVATTLGILLVVGAVVSGSLIEDAKRNAPRETVESPEGELMKRFVGVMDGTRRAEVIETERQGLANAKEEAEKASAQPGAARDESAAMTNLAKSHESMGAALFEDILGRGEHDKALEEYGLAIALWQSLLSTSPDSLEALEGLARAHAAVCEVHYDRFDMDAALRASREAEEAARRWARRVQSVRAGAAFERASRRRAKLLYEAGKDDAAMAFHRERAAGLRTIHKGGSNSESDRTLSIALGEAAHVFAGAAKTSESKSMLEESFALEAAASHVNDAWKRALASQHRLYAQLAKSEGKQAVAQEHSRACAVLYNQFGFSGNDAFDLACCAAQAGNADAAFHALRKALDSRWYNTQALERNTDLAPLRSDPRWRSLIARMNAARPQ